MTHQTAPHQFGAYEHWHFDCERSPALSQNTVPEQHNEFVATTKYQTLVAQRGWRWLWNGQPAQNGHRPIDQCEGGKRSRQKTLHGLLDTFAQWSAQHRRPKCEPDR